MWVSSFSIHVGEEVTYREHFVKSSVASVSAVTVVTSEAPVISARLPHSAPAPGSPCRKPQRGDTGVREPGVPPFHYNGDPTQAAEESGRGGLR